VTEPHEAQVVEVLVIGETPEGREAP